MLSYSPDDLLNQIKAAISGNRCIWDMFTALCPRDDKVKIETLLQFVLLKYIRMRARWFEKSVHECGKKTSTVVSKMETRKKVVVDSLIASAASYGRKEGREQARRESASALNAALEKENTVDGDQCANNFYETA